MRVTFLGTSGAFPTATRNATAHVVRVQGEVVLLDCGEGTQQQLQRSLESFMAHRIFISHLHLDHLLGLPGYVWTMALLNREQPLYVYVPRGTRAYVAEFIGQIERLCYPLHLIELDAGDEVQATGYKVRVCRVEHHAAPCLGFRIDENARPGKVDVRSALELGLKPGPAIGALVRGEPVWVGDRLIHPEEVVGPARPGRSVTYSGDTRPCTTLLELARGSQLLIHESMFLATLQQEALFRGHSTAAEAAQIATSAGVKLLAMTHISQRHQDSAGLSAMLEEARLIFPEAFLPMDLDSIELSLQD